MAVKFLEGKKVYLRQLTKEDCGGNYLAMVNDADNLHFVEGIGNRPINPDDLEQYVASNNNSSNLLLGIFENHTNSHVGNIHLSRITPHHNNCSYGIVMHNEFRGKGYAMEATLLLTRHAFSVMNLNRIHIPVVERNVPAIKMYEKLGAVKEGVMRQAFYFDGAYLDLIVYGLIKDDFYKRKG